MCIEKLNSEYPTDAEIEEMWAAYRESGRDGILSFLHKRTMEWQEAERDATGHPASRSNHELHGSHR